MARLKEHLYEGTARARYKNDEPSSSQTDIFATAQKMIRLGATAWPFVVPTVDDVNHHTQDKVCPLCNEKLESAHPYLQSWFLKLKSKYRNVHISCSWRGEAEQTEHLKAGKSQLPWPKSAHNYMENKKPCSLALDLFLIDEDGSARFPPLYYARVNQDNETERNLVFWGGRWKTLGDACHFEVQPPTPPKQVA